MRTGRHLSKRETCPHLLDGTGGETNNNGCSRRCDWIGSVYVLIKTVQLYEHAQTSQGGSHHETPSTKCKMTKEQNCVISCKASAPSISIIKTLHTSVRDADERGLSFPVIINTLTGDRACGGVQDESTVCWGMFTSHKRRLYVQSIQNTIHLNFNHKSSERINLCRDINRIQTQVLLKTLKSDFLRIDETNKTIHDTNDRYSH